MGRAFWLIALGRFLSSTGDGFFAPFTALYLTHRFGLSPAQVGLLMSAASFGSLLARIPGGALADRFGFRPIAIGAMCGAGIAVIGAGLEHSTAGFALAYAALNILVWGSFPAFAHGITTLVAKERHDEAFSILGLVQNGGFALGSVLGGLVALGGFSRIFWIDGISFFAFAAAVALALPRGRGAGRRADADAPAGAPTGSGEHGASRARGLRDIVYLPPRTARGFWRVAWTGLLLSVVYSQLGANLPIDIERRAGDTTWYGALWTLNAGMIALLQYPVTQMTARFHRRARMAAGAALYGLGAAVFLAAGPVWVYFFAFFVITVGEMLYAPLVTPEIAAQAPAGYGARYQGAVSLWNGAGWALGPTLGGLCLEYGGSVGLWLTMAALAWTSAWVLRPEPAGTVKRAEGSAAPLA